MKASCERVPASKGLSLQLAKILVTYIQADPESAIRPSTSTDEEDGWDEMYARLDGWNRACSILSEMD